MHIHHARAHATTGAFHWRFCRCGWVQVSWHPTGRLPRWTSYWGTDQEIRRQVRIHFQG